MKIVAGLGNTEDYETYVMAGASELFCGYIPGEWLLKYGIRAAVNRREVRYYNVQIGSLNDLMILRKKIEHFGIPVTIAFNSLFYSDDQADTLRKTIGELTELGYKDYIIASEKLFDIKNAKLHLSGEYGELNHELAGRLINGGISRIIFPRQTEIAEMKSIISSNPGLQYEAFVLNEKCHFTGAYCNSLHCDELCHACRIPYKITDMQYDFYEDQTEYRPGFSGCALCSLWRLRDAGITHIKLVSRGNSTEATRQDIFLLKKALEILEAASTEDMYITEMKKELFPKGCSINCYYILT